MKLLFIYILLLLNGGSKNIMPVLDKLLNNSFSEYSRIEYEVVNPKKFVSIKIADNAGLKRTGSYVYIPALVQHTAGITKREMISVKIKLYQKVLVAKKSYRKKEKLNYTDFEFIEKDVTNFNRELFTNLNEITSFRAKSFIKKGEILELNDVEKIPVVFSGDKLKAKFIDGNVMIEMDVIAKQDGYFGDIIRVMKNHTLFSAKVVDSQSVLIME